MSQKWMSHVTKMNEWRHKNSDSEWVTSQKYKTWLVNEWQHTFSDIIRWHDSFKWMSDVTNLATWFVNEWQHKFSDMIGSTNHVAEMNEWRHKNEWFMSRIKKWVMPQMQKSHVPHASFRTCKRVMSGVETSHVPQSRPTHGWVMFHTHHVTHMKKSRHT